MRTRMDAALVLILSDRPRFMISMSASTIASVVSMSVTRFLSVVMLLSNLNAKCCTQKHTFVMFLLVALEGREPSGKPLL